MKTFDDIRDRLEDIGNCVGTEAQLDKTTAILESAVNALTPEVRTAFLQEVFNELAETDV